MREIERIEIMGKPNEKQEAFFRSEKRFIAYGGSRGGGKSWALRRKLAGLALCYPGIRCLLVRRSYPELKANHLEAFLSEYRGLVSWNEGEKRLVFPNGSRIDFGYSMDDGDVLRYQGLEYDIIALDEATQLSEYRFATFKACLRGTSPYPRRMYLTCNPGGIGHAWVKRLFIDRRFRRGEDPEDYDFIAASVYDNAVLLENDPEYVKSLESLPGQLREAWLYGKWDIFEGQFFPEFDPTHHLVIPSEIPKHLSKLLAFDYGLDMLAGLVIGLSRTGECYVLGEVALPDLTLAAAAEELVSLIRQVETVYPGKIDYAVASPDLWNRRQDTGKSGFEVMQRVPGMPPMRPADNRRTAGWRIVREALRSEGEGRLHISTACRELSRCLPLLLVSKKDPEDASSEPHEVTHLPEALRYGLMARALPPSERDPVLPFRFRNRAEEGKRAYFEV